jgi:2-amino-4-hydroxy-6-hydroxymethyldihydropteridine diphosphokinase
VSDPRAPGRAGCLRQGAYLGLGSNEGDRLANLRAARDALPRHGVEVLAASPVYQTEPQGEVTDQPDFLNACLRVRTRLGPEALLDACKRVEGELGRARGGVRHGPRPIDVDVLLLGDLEYRSERLTVPHPEVASRRFVLEPLLELDPELRLPDGTPLRDLLPAVAGQRVTPHAGGSRALEVEPRPDPGQA